MRLKFLGSGDAFGSGGRFHTCMHVTTSETELLIDCGASSLMNCRRVVLTHMSTDMLRHIGDTACDIAEDGREFVV